MTAGPATPLRRLTKRGQFLRAARGKRAGRPAFALQAVANETADAGIGFTVTNKVGNAPERNRIRRRLREAVRARADDFSPGHDYVLVGRREALSLPYATMLEELSVLLTKVHANSARPAARQGDRNIKT